MTRSSTTSVCSWCWSRGSSTCCCYPISTATSFPISAGSGGGAGRGTGGQHRGVARRFRGCPRLGARHLGPGNRQSHGADSLRRLMLRHLGEDAAADRVLQAVSGCWKRGKCARRIGGGSSNGAVCRCHCRCARKLMGLEAEKGRSERFSRQAAHELRGTYI